MSQTVVKWLQGKQFVGIDSGRHSVVLSTQDPENATGCKPSDMLLVALGGCVAVDVVEILAKKRTPLASLEIAVDGKQDPEPPWAFRQIHLTFRLTGERLTARGVRQAIQLAEDKYCCVAATIRGVADITWDFELEGVRYPAGEPEPMPV